MGEQKAVLVSMSYTCQYRHPPICCDLEVKFLSELLSHVSSVLSLVMVPYQGGHEVIS
jgi:hypothetical protein